MEEKTIFFSYSRDNSDFVINLAKELRSAGAKIWLDQLDIKPGTRWDKSIEDALKQSGILLVVLSKSSVASDNVMDEVSYALEEGKTVVPVLLEDCEIPFRLRRLQFADFTQSREQGIATLNKALVLDKTVADKLEKEAATIDKAKSAPQPQSNVAQPVSSAPPKKKTGKGLLYALLGAVAVIVLIMVIPFGDDEESTDSMDSDTMSTEMTNEDDFVQQAESVADYDVAGWQKAVSDATVYSYLSYLYNTNAADPMFNSAMQEIRKILGSEGIVTFSDPQSNVYLNNMMYVENGEIKRDVEGGLVQIPVAGNVMQAFYPLEVFDSKTSQLTNVTIPKGYYVLVESVSHTEDGYTYLYVRY